MTVCCWLRSTQTVGLWGRILIRRTGASAWYAASVISGKLAFECSNSYPTYYTWIFNNTIIADGNWHFCCEIRDSSDGKIKFYLDGQPDGVGNDNTAGRSLDYGTPTAYIGSLGGSGNFYNGDFDEVSMYNRVLGATEILKLYNLFNI